MAVGGSGSSDGWNGSANTLGMLWSFRCRMTRMVPPVSPGVPRGELGVSRKGSEGPVLSSTCHLQIHLWSSKNREYHQLDQPSESIEWRDTRVGGGIHTTGSPINFPPVHELRILWHASGWTLRDLSMDELRHSVLLWQGLGGRFQGRVGLWEVLWVGDAQKRDPWEIQWVNGDSGEALKVHLPTLRLSTGASILLHQQVPETPFLPRFFPSDFLPRPTKRRTRRHPQNLPRKSRRGRRISPRSRLAPNFPPPP